MCHMSYVMCHVSCETNWASPSVSRPWRIQWLLYKHLCDSYALTHYLIMSVIICENIFMARPRPNGWIALLVQELRQWCWMGGFCIFVELHWWIEGLRSAGLPRLVSLRHNTLSLSTIPKQRKIYSFPPGYIYVQPTALFRHESGISPMWNVLIDTFWWLNND